MSKHVKGIEKIQGFTFNNPPVATWEVNGGVYMTESIETIRMYACSRIDLHDSNYPRVLRFADISRTDPSLLHDYVWPSEERRVFTYSLPSHVHPTDEFLRGEPPIWSSFLDNPEYEEMLRAVFDSVLENASYCIINDKELELQSIIGANGLGTPPLY